MNRYQWPIAVIAASLILTGSFQNCAPQPMDDTASSSATGSENSLYRLPGSQNQQFNSGITCAATVSASTIAVNAAFTFTITPSTTLPAGYRVVTYGTKNSVVDQFGETSSDSLIQSFTNPGYLGGSYSRYFQIMDAYGRALCETNLVTFTLAGNSCTLSTSTTFIKVGQAIVLNIAYAQANPAGYSLIWNGSNNGVEITGDPYGQTNINQWTSTAVEANRGVQFLRRLVVRNSNGTTFCQTNNVRIRVD